MLKWKGALAGFWTVKSVFFFFQSLSFESGTVTLLASPPWKHVHTAAVSETDSSSGQWQPSLCSVSSSGEGRDWLSISSRGRSWSGCGAGRRGSPQKLGSWKWTERWAWPSSRRWSTRTWVRAVGSPWRPLRRRTRWRGAATRTAAAGPWSWSWGRWCCDAAAQTRRLRPDAPASSSSGRPGRWWRSGRCLLDNGPALAHWSLVLNLRREEGKGQDNKYSSVFIGY